MKLKNLNINGKQNKKCSFNKKVSRNRELWLSWKNELKTDDLPCLLLN